ncbi:hypothetical protein [Iodobacter fluviatilis]|uniref:Immunity protein 43 domain-containing protein n=1 Tax=Iodobacter fluviatilis TaxID=537 RepID=A0A377Q7P7_9NEIS|nr:hypothetical protein [Iodobacter fluviatilis]TCU82643.1 hypothetical protein EV682_11415 [Iodobacter fluviatilis]STQ89871.1 Uncharacterised protein [Iodobacter fluviatilis]
MSKYNDDYFFVKRDSSIENLPDLAPDKDTAFRLFRSSNAPEGDAPYVFRNGALDYQLGTGVKPSTILPNIFMGSIHFFIENKTFEKFMGLNLPGMVCHPCIYIDHNDEWHENYWHIYIQLEIDCWDREKSTFDLDSKEENIKGVSYDVTRFSLNTNILDKIPLADRRIFMIGGVQSGGILIHKSLKDFFSVRGIKFIPILDYWG